MIHKKIVLLFAICILLYFGVSPALSVPAEPGINQLKQNDGSTFMATMWGDEWSHGWETTDGYSIIFNETTQDWTYAIPGADGNLVSSANIVGKYSPSDNIPKHIRPTGKTQLKVRNQKTSMASGVPDRAVPSTGTAKIPVILINFNNRSTTYTTASFNTLLFGSGTKSMKDYYEEVSYGKFSVSPGPGGVAGWYNASQSHDYYGQNDASGYDQWAGTLVREAVAAADPTLNFAPYDQDGDCYVDVVDLIHQGTDEAGGGPTTDIWSHSWNLNGAYSFGNSDGGEYTTNDACPKGGFIKVNEYVIQPETQSDGQITIGVFAHEYGHALGLPDLYDYTDTSAGVGDWSLMASGNWNGISKAGDTPAHLDAWCKWVLGWVSPVQVRTSSVTQIKRVEDNSVVYQLLDNPNGVDGIGEYFLVENRQKTGFDAALPGAGLLIWHIDESIGDNDNYLHKLVSLEEADGLNHLDNNINYGDANDPWYNKVVGFTEATLPNSKLYSGSASGVRVTNISASATTMIATLDGLYTGTPTPTTSTIGMYRNGVYYLRNTNTAGNADLAFTYGTTGDIPVTGDWNGDGIDTIGMYRNGVFYLRNTNTAGYADLAFTYGTTGDIPVTGDWNGDGIDTIGMYRSGVYYLRNTNTAGNADLAFTYGTTGDIPVTGDWNGDGIDTIGMYRNGVYYLRNTNTAGNADLAFTYGTAGDKPVTGKWI
ncbi:MAG: M6 family metalloprotease domain-containing protein [Methanoregula sp.]|nr:M6 family metalloprotease domain-containing protein [Methanoregula sp.]